MENDARLLANRISLLKQEEIKNYKKIDEIKKKAIEIYALKMEHEKKQEKVKSRLDQCLEKNIKGKGNKGKTREDLTEKGVGPSGETE